MSIPPVYSDLAKHGFEHVTRWVRHNDTIKLESLAWKETAGWIYAFVSEGRVRYVGITTMVLRSRMDSYAHLSNDRVRPLILQCLNKGQEVEIYGLRRQGVSKSDLEMEESQLMKSLRTDWNVRQ